MPSRILRESFVTSESVASLPPVSQDRLPRYFLLADDFGCFLVQPAVIRGRIFPLRPDVTDQMVRADLDAYGQAGILQLYDGDDGKKYAWFPHWNQHQRPPRDASKRRFPIPPSVHLPQSPAPAGNSLPYSQSQSQSQSLKRDPPVAPLNGGRAVIAAPRLKKRRRVTTLAEDLRFEQDAQRDTWSRALHHALQRDPDMSRDAQLAWVQRRCHASPEQAADIVALVEHAKAEVRA